MTNSQYFQPAPRALEVADWLEREGLRDGQNAKAAALLRSQHELIGELLEALKECADRLELHVGHTEDLIAHMAACKAIAKATGAQA